MQNPVVVLVGAGLSTASGIPDYRSGDGMWTRFDPDEFHITRFYADPDRFWARRVELVKEMRILDAEPNDGHRVLADAVKDGRVSHVITQNIEGLHHKAGTPADRIIEVHGNSAACRCIACGRTALTRDVIDAYAGAAPRCGCGGLLKPDVVLFGEPVTELERAQEAMDEANTLVTVGTSLQVWPVAGLVQQAVARKKDVVIVNRDPTPFDTVASRIVRGDAVEGLRSLFVQSP